MDLLGLEMLEVHAGASDSKLNSSGSSPAQLPTSRCPAHAPTRAGGAERERGRRVRVAATLIEPCAAYCRQRPADDPHLWAATLFDELTASGCSGSYPRRSALMGCGRHAHLPAGDLAHSGRWYLGVTPASAPGGRKWTQTLGRTIGELSTLAADVAVASRSSVARHRWTTAGPDGVSGAG
jgi:hypothetical protein